MKRTLLPGTFLALISLTACQPTIRTSLPAGSAAYGVIPSKEKAPPQESYRVGSDDVLQVQVFNEPELTRDEVRVDDTGEISLLLIGMVQAAGKNTTELARDIEDRYRQHYLRNPSVVVSVKTAARRIVTVEGEVKMPGVYEIEGPYTLLSAIARAQSPTPTAKLDQVMVFRTVDGKRAGAVFNLSAIRGGNQADPQILPGDVVIVGYSALRGAYRDFLASAPILAIFRTY